MSSIQDTEVDLNKPLSRLYVPYDDLIVLFEANHYLWTINWPVDASYGALRDWADFARLFWLKANQLRLHVVWIIGICSSFSRVFVM